MPSFKRGKFLADASKSRAQIYVSVEVASFTATMKPLIIIVGAFALLTADLAYNGGEWTYSIASLLNLR